MTARPTKDQTYSLLLSLIAGLQKHFANGSLTLGSAVFTVAALVQLLQTLASAMTAQLAAEKAASDSLSALRALQVTDGPIIQALKDLLIAQFGNSSQTLADFGLSPRKTREPMTVAQKAAAAAKRQATRLARGTVGPKAKLAIKGVVPVAPEAAAPTAPAAAVSTAPAAATATTVAKPGT